MKQVIPAPQGGLTKLLKGPWLAVVVLGLFWVFMNLSVRDKSPAYDEGVHVASGYSYWATGDFRLNPENGNLPQQLMSLPFYLNSTPLPGLTSQGWLQADEWTFSDQWLYRMGISPRWITTRGRAAISLLAVALGALVFAWARKLFGPTCGIVALGLYVFCPAVLANGPMMASDTAAALFFLASTWALWSALEKLTPSRVLVAGLSIGCLFASKMSATLIVPIGLILAVVRLCNSTPLPVRVIKNKSVIKNRGAQVAAFLVGSLAIGLIAITVIWGFYDFRFAMSNGSDPKGPSPRGTPSWLSSLPASFSTNSISRASKRTRCTPCCRRARVDGRRPGGPRSSESDSAHTRPDKETRRTYCASKFAGHSTTDCLGPSARVNA